jgi:hypothetical protein
MVLTKRPGWVKLGASPADVACSWYRGRGTYACPPTVQFHLRRHVRVVEANKAGSDGTTMATRPLRPPWGQAPPRRCRRPSGRDAHRISAHYRVHRGHGPLGDRDERTDPGQHRAHYHSQDHSEGVSHSAPLARVRHLAQHRHSTSERSSTSDCPRAARWPIAGSIRDDDDADMVPLQ